VIENNSRTTYRHRLQNLVTLSAQTFFV